MDFAQTEASVVILFDSEGEATASASAFLSVLPGARVSEVLTPRGPAVTFTSMRQQIEATLMIGRFTLTDASGIQPCSPGFPSLAATFVEVLREQAEKVEFKAVGVNVAVESSTPDDVPAYAFVAERFPESVQVASALGGAAVVGREVVTFFDIEPGRGTLIISAPGGRNASWDTARVEVRVNIHRDSVDESTLTADVIGDQIKHAADRVAEAAALLAGA